MKKEKIYLIILAISSSLALSESFSPDKGLEIIPLKNMAIPDSYKKELSLRMQEEKTKGYYETNSSYARYLLGKKKNFHGELSEFKNNRDPSDTHLKKQISDLKLAFAFNGIPIPKENIMGYAAIGAWTENGWTGIKTFFEDKNFGICSYSLFNISLSHGAVQLNNETTEYIVNKKPSSANVEGSVDSGFLYEINWFDKTYVHFLQCAKPRYELIIQKLVDFANQIDTYVE